MDALASNLSMCAMVHQDQHAQERALLDDWQPEAAAAAETERLKTWRRLRFKLARHPDVPFPASMGPEQRVEIQELRLRVRGVWPCAGKPVSSWNLTGVRPVSPTPCMHKVSES